MKKNSEIIYRFEPLWGAWKIEEFVGEGNFGRVYKVSREEWGQKYISAVKLISIPQSANDYKEAQTIGIGSGSMEGYFEDFVRNIVSEIELMYKLKGNSNIVSYEDHMIIKKEDEIGWHILIKMEFVQSLTDYVANNEVSISDVLKLGTDICKALETCEKYNIIHRDIKDDNIFVSKAGNFKLGDFGIAKELSKSGRTASMRGTPLYMAPEVYKGENYDCTVDTYSLGIVMYKLLNKGRLPFMPPYPDNITYNDTENSIESRMRGEVPKLPVDAENALGELVLKAISYNPSDRFKSPGEMRQALERVIGMMEERAGSAMLKDADADKAVDINEYAATGGGLADKSLDSSIIQKVGGKHSKTVSIFDNDPQNLTKTHVETAAIFKNIKSNNIERTGRGTDANAEEADSHIEEDDFIGGMDEEIKEDLDIAGKYIAKSNIKKNDSKIMNLLPFLIIALIIVTSGMILMLGVGNKGPDTRPKTAVNEKKNTSKSETDTYYYEEAKKEYEKGNYEAALDLVTMELNQNSNDANAISLQIMTKSKLSDALYEKGMAFLKENKLKEAQASFEAAVRMYRPNTEAQKQLDKVNELINKKD